MTKQFPRTSSGAVTERDFVEKLRRLNLVVETIANGHGWVGSMKAFEEALKRSSP